MAKSNLTVRFQYMVSPEVAERVDNMAKKLGVTRSAFCAMAIGKYLYEFETAEMNAQRSAEDMAKTFEKLLSDFVNSAQLPQK